MTALKSDTESKNTTFEERIMIEKDRFLKFIKERNDFIKKLPDMEKKAFIASIEEMKESKDKIERLLMQKKSRKSIDGLLFSFEELPLFGKEYWFMKFTSNNGSKRQFFLMFGRSAGDIEVNGRYVEDSQVINDRTGGYCVSWAYDDAQRWITDDFGTIEVTDGKINCSNGDIQADFYGSFPKYTLSIANGGVNICSVDIREPVDDDYDSELSEHFKGLFGYRLANLYFDFKGELFGRDFSGKCYVQKVVVVGPFIPWKWSRIVFRNGSILTYYIPSIEVMGLEYEIYNSMSFYDADTKLMHSFKKATVHEYPSEKGDKRWVITAEGNNVFVVTKSYCRESFSFKNDFNFNYVENLVEVMDLKIETDSKVITLEETGSGLGMVEDTSGFVI
ncbi:hypothetical protein [Methanolobus sp.]|jgi:hypothetical protein|uniref:hypothetical protein n=1 Tax=Methanolobus sp. TaxID=1874737 RepID=UPI0025D34DB7|nr:hypothetical protein [Methanolobus sp.]